jgi:CRISPR-associated exonuclease Cas4
MRGEIVYADQQNDELLVSERFCLTGRPDYILEQDGELVPVERTGPHDGGVLQLAAYCLLVEDRYQTTVRRGQLQYLNRPIDVLFDDVLRGKLLRTLEAVDQASGLREVPRSDASPARCGECGFRNRCDEGLG